MAKDPAFLFYYQDFLVGTDDFTNEEVGAYTRCLCYQAAKGCVSEKHMKNICNSQDIQNIIKKKFIFDKDADGYVNNRLKVEIEKRRKYSESRSGNRLGKKKDKKNSITYDIHMEDENTNENENENKEFGKYENLLCPRMVKVFKSAFPNYPVKKEADYPNCLQIAYNIAESNSWNKKEVFNGKMDDTVKFWEQIVQFGKSDSWFSSRSLSDYNKEWQRLIQKINSTNGKPNNQTKQGFTREGLQAEFDKRFGQK